MTSKVEIVEGLAKILFPSQNQVFYNPVQQYNRDLSIAVIRTYKEELGRPIKILEALSATGLRAIRYAKEIEGISQIVANDLDPNAVQTIKENVEYNGLSLELVKPNEGDANMTMYLNKETFDVIDLDPYGSAAPFLDAAVSSIKDGGLLCVTCTDMAVLCGSYSEACFAKYGSMSLKGDACHEMALRIILSSIETAAAKQKKYIEPLISCSIDFYARVFVKIRKSAQQSKHSASKKSIVFQCTTCKTCHLQPIGKIVNDHKFIAATFNGESVCSNCNSNFHIGGPIWNRNSHDSAFIVKLLAHIKASTSSYATHSRMLGMVSVVSEELDVPLLWSPSFLANLLHCVTPSLVEFNSAILNAGYKVSVSHTSPLSAKTDAPSDVIWDIMRAWVKLHPIQLKNVSEFAPARKILAVPSKTEVNFQVHKDSNPPSRRIKLVRFQENPEKNWGPKPRAKKAKSEE